MLADGRCERAGRAKRLSQPVCDHHPAIANGVENVDSHRSGMFTASIIAVGDEIL